MKTKYQKLTKSEKKEIKETYYKTEDGKAMKNRLTRLLITGSMGIIFSIYLFYTNYKNDGNNIWEYILSGILLVASIIFIIGSYKIKHKVLNKEAIKSSK